MAGETMTADQWLSTPYFQKYTILDPDGWDRKNFDASWNEKIDRDEFNRRLMLSTILVNNKGAQYGTLRPSLHHRLY